MSLNRAKLLGLLVALAALLPASARACATCYGASDSPLAQGMNWGILVLLGFVFLVLTCVSAFFVYLWRRGSTMAGAAAPTSIDSKP